MKALARPKRLTAAFYRLSTGAQPVRDWLLTLSRDDRRTIGADILTVELGWPIGMPVCRSLGKGLYEVRSSIRKGQVEARVYFAIGNGLMLLLHGHEGKNRQASEIGIARTRLADFRTRQ